MFRVEKAASASDHKVVNDEWGVWIQFLSSRGRSSGGVFKLVVGETVIPFEINRDFIQDANDAGHFLTRFDIFGLSPAESVRGVTPNVIISPAERRQYMLLAAEALLIFGGFYDGDSKPEGYNRVELDGAVYTLASFGYEFGASPK